MSPPKALPKTPASFQLYVPRAATAPQIAVSEHAFTVLPQANISAVWVLFPQTSASDKAFFECSVLS